MRRALGWALPALAGALLAGCGATVPELVINEFMADNATVLQADDGTFPDWIELYNADDHDVSLQGIYITDVLAAPTMWELPADETMAPGDFLLLLADGTTEAGHVVFRLDRGGEEIGLFSLQGDHAVTIDAVSYDSQPEDQSSARVPDGSAEWVLTDTPTPGESNG